MHKVPLAACFGPAWALGWRWCPPETERLQPWAPVRPGNTPATLERLFGMTPLRRAGFVHRATGVDDDVAFSRLGRRKRRLPPALEAPLALAGYRLHPPRAPGSATAVAGRRASP